MKRPILSVIICTYNKSGDTLEIPLKSLAKQKCSKELYEIIFADNNGGKAVSSLAKQYGCKLVKINGKPSQVCRQVNKGAEAARGGYVLLQDHDIGIDENFIGNLIKAVKNKGENISAWYIPYKIVARGRLLQKIRNFEESFYRNSIIAAPRLIKKSIFIKAQFDHKVSSGAPDWDFTNQLRLLGIKFGYLKDYFYHYEEKMSFWQFVSKKVIYNEGGEIYQNKWKNKDKLLYDKVVKKQYDPVYRLFGIFIEKGKWKKLILGFHLYIMFLFVKGTMSLIYFHYLLTQKLKHLFLR